MTATMKSHEKVRKCLSETWNDGGEEEREEQERAAAASSGDVVGKGIYGDKTSSKLLEGTLFLSRRRRFSAAPLLVSGGR